MVFDVAWVFADEIVGKFIDRSRHSVRAAFQHGLAPAGDAFVGFDFEEALARRDDERGESGDLHGAMQCAAKRVVV